MSKILKNKKRIVCLLAVMVLLLSGVLTYMIQSGKDKGINPKAAVNTNGINSATGYQYWIQKSHLHMSNATISVTGPLVHQNGSETNYNGETVLDQIYLNKTLYTANTPTADRPSSSEGLYLSLSDDAYKTTIPGASISIDFNNGCIGYDGNEYHVQINITNISVAMKSVAAARGNTCGTPKLFEELKDSGCGFCALKYDDADGGAAFSYDVSISIHGSHNADGSINPAPYGLVLNRIPDLDQPDVNEYYGSNLNRFQEGIRFISGIDGNMGYVDPNTKVKISGDMFLSGEDHSGDWHLTSVGYLGASTGHSFRWSGNQCMSFIGLSRAQSNPVTVSVIVHYQQENGNYDEPGTTVHTKTQPYGQAFSYTYPSSNIDYNVYKNPSDGLTRSSPAITQNTVFHIYIPRKSYTVVYDGNGGTNFDHWDGEFTQNTVYGSMANQTVLVGQTFNLSPNVYTRDGFRFVGWGTSPGGGVAYSNQQAVCNLSTTDGAVVTLYAQWQKILGNETVNVVSEETGNPVANVSMKLQRNVNGNWVDVTNGTTGSGGEIQVSNLHWFNYRWVVTGSSAGYTTSTAVYPGPNGDSTKSPYIPFTIKPCGSNVCGNCPYLTTSNKVVLYMKHVNITLNSQVNCIIKGEDAPAFLYHISGNDVAGIKHEYNVLIQTNKSSKSGRKSLVHDIFAGTYKVTQVPVSRYVAGTARNVSHTTPNGINATVNVKDYTSAEVTFPYTLTNHGWYYGVDSKTNQLRK